MIKYFKLNNKKYSLDYIQMTQESKLRDFLFLNLKIFQDKYPKIKRKKSYLRILFNLRI
jgi:hypothetical protein